MICLKKFALLFLLMATTGTLLAQTVKVKKDQARIKGENTDGVAIDINAKADEVTASFAKYMKALGKTRTNDGTITLTESTINGAGYKNPVYGVVKENGQSSQVWLGVKSAEWSEGVTNINKDLEKAIHDFGIKFHRDKIQTQIDESSRAAQAVEKQQQRLTTQSRELNTKLEDNKREKIQLEKSLENNKVEYDMLLKKIAKNKHDQDSVATSGVQIKKVIEAQRVKQGKVN